MTPSKVRDLVYEILSQKLREALRGPTWSWILPTSCPMWAGSALNVFQQRDSVGAVFRTIPFEILSLRGSSGSPGRCGSSPTCSAGSSW